MSTICSNETELEELLRRLHAEGEYRKMLKAVKDYRDRQSASGRDHIKDPATNYQRVIAMSRLGQLEEAMSLRLSDMTGWPGFTAELKGDWYRDGLALFYLSKGDFRAARGAVTEAMSLHKPGTPKYLLDMLAMALVYVVQNRPVAAYEGVKAVLVEMKEIKGLATWLMAKAKEEAESTNTPFEAEPMHNFDSVERIASWRLLLMKGVIGDNEGFAELARWVAEHDVSIRRQTQALKLQKLEGKARTDYANRLIKEDIERH